MPQSVMVRRHGVHGHVGHRHDHVGFAASRETQQEPFEGGPFLFGRRIRDVTGAVPRHRGEARFGMLADEHGHAAAAERSRDRKCRSLAAVGYQDP
jgi:hypothetical protein